MKQNNITDDLPALLSVLPSEFTRVLNHENQSDDLLEIIMDLGRIPGHGTSTMNWISVTKRSHMRLLPMWFRALVNSMAITAPVLNVLCTAYRLYAIKKAM